MKQPVNNSPANETVGQNSSAVEATEVKPTVSDTQRNLNTGVTKSGNSDERISDADAAVQAAMRLAEQFAEQNEDVEPKQGNSNIFSAQHNSARSVTNDKTVNEEASVHSNSLSVPKLGDSKDSKVPTDVLAEEARVTLYQDHVSLKKGLIPSLIDNEEDESASEHSSVYDEDDEEEEEEDFETQSETSSDGSESGESSESESEYSTSEDEESNSDDSTDSDADSEPKTNPVAHAPFKQPNFVHGIERLSVEQTPASNSPPHFSIAFQPFYKLQTSCIENMWSNRLSIKHQGVYREETETHVCPLFSRHQHRTGNIKNCLIESIWFLTSKRNRSGLLSKADQIIIPHLMPGIFSIWSSNYPGIISVCNFEFFYKLDCFLRIESCSPHIACSGVLCKNQIASL